MNGYIYKIINTKTDDIYIGSTIQQIKNRFKAHKSNAKIGKTGKLYDHMREHGIEIFSVELLEKFEINSKEDLGIRERKYHEELRPSLNMKAPNIVVDKNCGRIYCIFYTEDKTKNYIGSTTKNVNGRLGDHKSASNDGTTPFYKFMREHGKENFEIECLEDGIPVDQLIIREDHWIKERNPTLNKNINLCITDKERDRLKYLKNREKRLAQVNERRLLKRDEINAQKMEHYYANKDRINQKDKDKRKELREKEIVLYEQNPLFTEETLSPFTIFQLKEIALRFGLNKAPRLKPKLIDRILTEQKSRFAT